MTSSDVLDTAFNIQLKQSVNILLADIDKILLILKNTKNINLHPVLDVVMEFIEINNLWFKTCFVL